MATTVICEACYVVRLAFLDIRQVDFLAVCRPHDDQVEVLFVAGSAQMMEHGMRELRVHVEDETWKDPVVPDMVMAIVFLCGLPDSLQPFDTTAPDVSWNHQANWITVIWG